MAHVHSQLVVVYNTRSLSFSSPDNLHSIFTVRVTSTCTHNFIHEIIIPVQHVAKMSEDKFTIKVEKKRALPFQTNSCFESKE